MVFCHPATKRGISRVRICLTGRIHKDGAPRSWNPKKRRAESSRPTGRQHPSRKSAQSGRNGRAHPPLWGGSHAPPCLGGGWVAAVWRDNAFTREARLEGERVIHKRERTLVLSLLCAVRPRTPTAAGVQRATAAQWRLLASRRPRSHPRSEAEAKQLTVRQYRWLMEGLSIDQPKAHQAAKKLSHI